MRAFSFDKLDFALATAVLKERSEPKEVLAFFVDGGDVRRRIQGSGVDVEAIRVSE